MTSATPHPPTAENYPVIDRYTVTRQKGSPPWASSQRESFEMFAVLVVAQLRRQAGDSYTYLLEKNGIYFEMSGPALEAMFLE